MGGDYKHRCCQDKCCLYAKNTDLPAGICFSWENFGRHEGEAMGRHEAEAMGRHEAEAMGRQTDLVLDASLPKHKN